MLHLPSVVQGQWERFKSAELLQVPLKDYGRVEGAKLNTVLVDTEYPECVREENERVARSCV